MSDYFDDRKMLKIDPNCFKIELYNMSLFSFNVIKETSTFNV